MSDDLRVLCVDDEQHAAALTESYLQRELDGGDVVTAQSGADALAVLDEHPIDCVVSDYEMPDMSGLELLKAVRERDPDLPFILFTGRGSEEVASDAISAGVTDYLQKAGTEKYELLANRIENAVGQRRAEEDLDEARRKLERLHDSALELRQVQDQAVAYERARDAAVEVLAFDVCGFFEAEDGVFVPVTSSGDVDYGDELVATSEGIVGRAYRTGDSMLLDDVAAHDDVGEDGGDWRSCFTIPVGDHGVFQAVAAEPGVFDREDRKHAQLLVAHLAATLDRLRYEADIEAARQKVEELHELAFRLREVDDADAVYDHATDAAREVLDFDVCGFFVHDDGAFRPAALENIPPTFKPLDSDEGIIGRTFRTGESSLVADVTEDPDAEPRGEDFRACISVPMGDHGVFQAISTEPGFFDESDRELAELLVSHVAGTLDRIDYQVDLETTNSQLETVLSNTTANIYIKDLEGRYTLVNEAFAENLGMPREHIVGRTDEEVQDPGVAAEVRANDRLAVEEGRPIEVEESAGWADEERVYYSIKAPLFDEDGEPRGVCGVSSDITDLKAHQRELERKTERLEEFASVVSHDLRNPLTVAQGYADILADEDGQAAEELQTSLSRMEEIIEDLLTLAREGREVGETEAVAIGAVAEEAWRSVDTADATLVVDCERTVQADASRLLQAFENLIRNAVEHGGPDVTVRIEETDDGFAVVDDGDGLPDDGDLLDAGVSTKTRGTGVGLTIVDRVAEAHGWELVACDDGGVPASDGSGVLANEESEGSSERGSDGGSPDERREFGSDADERSDSETDRSDGAGGARFEFRI